MGHLFRSRNMTLLQMIISTDSLYESVGEIGEIGAVMFKDLNEDVNSFSRTFVKQVRLGEEMERKLRYFGAQMEDAGIVGNADHELLAIDAPAKYNLPAEHEIEELDQKFTQLESELREMNENESNLNKNYLELTELRHIVNETAQYFTEAESHAFSGESSTSVQSMTGVGLVDESRPGQAGGVKLGFVTGVVDRDKFQSFERVLWRACRGNVFLRRSDIEEELRDPKTNQPIFKSVFIAFFQGDVLENKVKRICDGFGATLYPCPEPANERRALSDRVNQSISELEMVIARTKEFRKKVLKDISLEYEGWMVKTKKVLMAYHTMNKFKNDVSGAALVAEGWAPVERLNEVHAALNRATQRSGGGVPAIVKRIPTRAAPPTWNINNKYTKATQTIMDAYGVPTYGEVNPTLWALISFPFLFAVMFGDIGHGFIMALFAFMCILNEKSIIAAKSSNEMWTTIFQGRYIIFLMGVFSIYTGVIYNDFFSKMVFMFPSGWAVPTLPFEGTYKLNTTGLCYAGYTDENGGQLCPMCPDGCGWTGNPYPLGIDPMWALTENKLNFLNSYKMKMSVLLGVIHMSAGISMQVFNHLHFPGQSFRVWAEYIPQITFLVGIFGYMDIMILMKWCMTFPPVEVPATDAAGNPTGEMVTMGSDPNLLVTTVNMFLSPGKVSYEDKTYLYAGQGMVQLVLLVIALICVPWMLCAKPIVIKMRMNKEAKAKAVHHDEGEGHAVDVEGHGEHGEEHEDFGEVVVEQCIHTIEFCLGAVSNTASYLRLWALSLAHAQLSEVLWDMVMSIGWGSPFMAFIMFGAWAVLTMAILLAMEGMSAFLHALRLHWVEFNNKFFKGEGYAFKPLKFEKCLKYEN